MFGGIIAFLSRLRRLIRKETLIILKDPANRLILIIPVLMQSVLFGYAATFDLTDIPYILVEQSHSASARDFLARLDGTGIFHRVAELPNNAEVPSLIDKGAALIAIQIPADFERQLRSGREGQVQVLLDGRNSTTAGVALNYLSTITSSLNAARGAAPPIELRTRAWFNPNLETRWNIMPAMLASLTLIQILVLAGLSVAREREQGTFDQMLVTPLNPMEILLGKAIPPVIIGMFQTTVVLMVALHWFKIPLAGSLIPLFGTLFIFTFSVVGLGLCLSAVSKNMQQAMIFCFVLLLPMILLSGLATPIKAMPVPMQIATYANPLRFAIVAVRRIYLEGCGFADVAVNFIPMLVVSAIALPLAAWLFRNRLT